MKILLSLHKKIDLPHCIGFLCATFLYVFAGSFFLKNIQNKSIRQDGHHRFTLSIQSINPPSPTQSDFTPNKIIKKMSKTPVVSNKKSIEKNTKNIQENNSKPQQTPKTQNNVSESTQETLMYNVGVSDQFLSKIHSLIASNNSYPRIAKRQKLQGEIIVEFILEANGKIKDVKIVQSNAKEILEKSALKALYRASEFFPQPQKRVKIRVPILYKLT